MLLMLTNWNKYKQMKIVSQDNLMMGDIAEQFIKEFLVFEGNLNRIKDIKFKLYLKLNIYIGTNTHWKVIHLSVTTVTCSSQ